MKTYRVFLFTLLGFGLLLTQSNLLAQQTVPTRSEEDKIYLLSAREAELFELFGINYRKVTGPARFLHNNTFILCDTAIWNTREDIIDAIGNVEIIQEGTRLTGETIHYIGNQNIAQVRGKVVELTDKENNRLRTKHLDFNTKDSIGYFFNGGSMLDTNATIMESRRGYYYSKEKLFCFYDNVEMGTDTLKIKADSLYYHSDLELAKFWGNIQAWHTDGFLTSERGTYEKKREWFHFLDDVLVLTEEQEIRAEDVFYDRNYNSGTLKQNVQVRDTTQQILILGDRLDFRRKPDWVQVTEDPVFITYEIDKETHATDSLFLRADTLRIFTTTYGSMDSLERVQALARQSENQPTNAANKAETVNSMDLSKENTGQTDSLDVFIDMTEVLQFLYKEDSLLLANVRHQGDSLFNTIEVHFLYGYNNVRVFKSDLQSVCDSIVFNSIDSVLRQYGKPILWNEESQLSADSIWFRFSRDSLYRVDLYSNAFLISQEEETFFHQIKADLMQAHVRENDVYRFDALKNTKALFYIPEDSLITSLNIKECDEMNVFLKERKAQRIIYKQAIKSDMIPLFDLRKEQERLAGFLWREEERPKDNKSITERTIRDIVYNPDSIYKAPLYPYTLQYFPLEHARSAVLRNSSRNEAREELSRRERETETESSPIQKQKELLHKQKEPPLKQKGPIPKLKESELMRQEIIQK